MELMELNVYWQFALVKSDEILSSAGLAKHKASQTANISRGAAVANLSCQEVQQFLLRTQPRLICCLLPAATRCQRTRLPADRLCSTGASGDTSTAMPEQDPGQLVGGRGGSSPGADERCHYLIITRPWCP